MRKFLIAVALLAPVALPVSPAHAQDDVAVVTGEGTITPGLPDTGCTPNQAIFFGGTAVAQGDHAGTYNIFFNGNSTICESLGAGQGTGNLSGSGITGTVDYIRTGSHVTITGQGAVNGTPHVIVRGDCVFAPTSIGPVRTYGLACTVVLEVS